MNARATAWLSRGFEQLLYEQTNGAPGRALDYDVVIVGSGYGGAMAAAELAGCTVEVEKDGGTKEKRPLRVCVLERGKEYLPGMFPARFSDLAGHTRFNTSNSLRTRGNREGLFDIRVGSDVCALVANGLGGGSLINAGVMEQPIDEVFEDAGPDRASSSAWPVEFRSKAARDAIYGEAKAQLGVLDGDGENNIERHPKGVPDKYLALRQLAGGKPFRAASIAVAMRDKHNTGKLALSECKLCGDCATGCNHGAKDSLDLNLLVQASRWRKAEIYTGASVLRIERDADLRAWILTVVHTDEKLRARQGGSFKLKADKVILAAGTFGSTEILLRSRSGALQFSACLGSRFSANGDTIAVAYKQKMRVNAVAQESIAPGRRAVGPTITGLIDLRRQKKHRYVIQELAIPSPLRRVFEETVATSHALHALGVSDRGRHSPADSAHDPCAIDADAISRSSVFAVMGNDGAGGTIQLVEGKDAGDGCVKVCWPGIRDSALFQGQVDVLEKLARRTGGTILPNPLWQLLPDNMQFLLDNRRGPLLTVHPLGGCPMGETVSAGVVDHLGRVFDAAPAAGSKAVQPGLVVLDGSIVPASLGINPALTIAALALNAVRQLRTAWNFHQEEVVAEEEERPIFAEAPGAETPRETEVEIIERMSGKATLTSADGALIRGVIELTLKFDPLSLASLVLPGHGDRAPMARRLRVREGELRLFEETRWTKWRNDGEPKDWQEKDQKTGLPVRVSEDSLVLLRAPLSGTLTVLHREKSTWWARVWRALWAWLGNRGLRDLWQSLCEGRFWRSLRSAGTLFSLASRAGQVRLLDYDLTIGTPDSKALTPGSKAAALADVAFAGQRIRGRKRLTYARRSNPWRQLAEMELEEFPGLESSLRNPVLKLDVKYLAREGVPLLRIVEQHDQPAALLDLASLSAYFLRLLLSIHVWSFRKPDSPRPRRVPPRAKPARPGDSLRLPGHMAGLPEPVVCDLPDPCDRNVCARLTRYKAAGAEGRPVVMIHGYSASGTTFAHHAVRPNMASYFCGRNRDVWIVDLRTSSGMPTARRPWAFEDAALRDLPAAFAHIRKETGQKIDVFAHCMGAAMFSMVVLKPPEPHDAYAAERRDLPGWIHSAVLSQIGPVVVMSPANIFRAYVTSYLRRFLPFESYDFEVKPDAGLADQLLDRLLATLPYPEEEFDIENPPWPPWRRTAFAGTRHRMDALYGRDFSLADKDGRVLLDDKVLEHIDDLFGPLSIETVAQGIHLAHRQLIATREGRNPYVSRANLRGRWTFPTLSIHGEDNGLADVATLARIEKIVIEDAGKTDYRTHAFPGFGHQDSLIGKKAEQVFECAFNFLEEAR